MGFDINNAPPGQGTAGTSWAQACDWAINCMPCPAFRCDPHGAVVSYNAAAQRLWGGTPSSQERRWGGFVALWLPDRRPVDAAFSPAALAAAGEQALPLEMIAESMDGHARRLVFHARPLYDDDNRLAGSLCAITDISERCRLEQQARTVNDDRSTFLSMLGHELRNPLAPIMSAATTLRACAADPSTARMAEVVERQAKQLSRFIADLLQAARLDGPEVVPMAPCDTDVGEVLDRAVDVASASMHARGQSLRVQPVDRSAGLRCDPERIAQALGNVLLNASDYSAEGAHIGLRASIEAGFLEASVLDNGIGIEPGKLHEIFEPFRSLAQSPDRAKPGAGLGLTIAKRVAEAHGGAISVQSPGPGFGVTVTFSLPIVKAA